MNFLFTISENPLFISGFYPVSNKRKNIFVTVGLPGTGKSTFCERIYNNCIRGTAKIFCRDKYRIKIVNKKRDLPLEKQLDLFKNIDSAVTAAEIDDFAASIVGDSHLSTFLFDGCHTLYADLQILLESIHQVCDRLNESYALHLCVLGSPLSKTNHTLTNKKKNDFSDFDTEGNHHAVPVCVMNMKRKEFFALTHPESFNRILEYCDYVYSIPAFNIDDFN